MNMGRISKKINGNETGGRDQREEYGVGPGPGDLCWGGVLYRVRGQE